MIESYLIMLVIWTSIALLFLVLAALTHLDYRDAESAGYVRLFLYALPAGLVWPLVMLAALGYMVYAVGKSVSEVFSKEYR